MISQITGTVASTDDLTVSLTVGPLRVDVLTAAHAAAVLGERAGQEVTLATLLILEGNLSTGSLTPRLIGFPTPAEREFFQLLTRVKGVSTRKALRALHVPVTQIAAAIAAGDEKLLTTLPEIGKRTAAQLVTELREHMAPFVVPAAAAAAPTLRPLNDAQRVALDILVGWGDRRADAERWVAAAVEAEPALSEPEAIVRAAYRAKQGG